MPFHTGPSRSQAGFPGEGGPQAAVTVWEVNGKPGPGLEAWTGHQELVALLERVLPLL